MRASVYFTPISNLLNFQSAYLVVFLPAYCLLFMFFLIAWVQKISLWICTNEKLVSCCKSSQELKCCNYKMFTITTLKSTRAFIVHGVYFKFTPSNQYKHYLKMISLSIGNCSFGIFRLSSLWLRKTWTRSSMSI